MKKVKITVGIPAYNEEQNIADLIKSVMAQKTDKIDIHQIIVSSDGSNDGTVSEARKFKRKKVQVIDNKNRRGIARGLNQARKEATGDILVTLDADIKIKDKRFIEKLVRSIVDGKADLTSSRTYELTPKTFVSKCLFVSMRLKEEVFNSLNNGDNLYTCHGLARGYSKSLFSRMNFKVSVGNDMYSYLYCVSNGYKYKYAKSAIAYYQLPQSFGDHAKQSKRFFVSANEQGRYFDKDLITRSTTIPKKILAVSAVKMFRLIMKNPLHTIGYFFIQLYLRYKSKSFEATQTWDMANSSKQL